MSGERIEEKYQMGRDGKCKIRREITESQKRQEGAECHKGKV